MSPIWRLLVSPRDLKRAVEIEERDDLVVLDCRHALTDPSAGRRAFEKAHIPGAVHAHVDEDLSGPVGKHTGRHPLPSVERLRDRVEGWGITPETQVVAYDDVGGAFAARAWWLLRHHGHERVAVLDGGMPAYERIGGRLTVEVSRRKRSVYPLHPGSCPVVEAEELEKRVPVAQGELLDARDPERYRGETEPIDPVAGHIPGAVNMPFKWNLGEDGKFRAPDELQALYSRLLGGRDPREVAVYCGSGVTASHDILAMELAGLEGAALYPGSWSHWVSRKQRPVSREDEGPAGG